MSTNTVASAIPQGPDAVYAQSLAEGVWRVQRCTACKLPIFYPRTACTHCGSLDYTWFEPNPLGVVHSTTVMRRPAPAGGDLHLCLIDLDDGFRMMSRVDGVAPASVAIDDRVEAFIGERDGTPLVLFRKTGASA